MGSSIGCLGTASGDVEEDRHNWVKLALGFIGCHVLTGAEMEVKNAADNFSMRVEKNYQTHACSWPDDEDEPEDQRVSHST